MKIEKKVHRTYTNFYYEGKPHDLIVSVNNDTFLPHINGATTDTASWKEISDLLKHAYDEWHSQGSGEH
jgi:hypothetical protein